MPKMEHMEESGGVITHTVCSRVSNSCPQLLTSKVMDGPYTVLLYLYVKMKSGSPVKFLLPIYFRSSRITSKLCPKGKSIR